MSVEPISPELVLVCPELREEALATQPPAAWELLRDTLRPSPEALSVEAPTSRERLRVVPSVATGLVRLALIVCVVAVMVTLTLTLVANEIR